MQPSILFLLTAVFTFATVSTADVPNATVNPRGLYDAFLSPLMRQGLMFTTLEKAKDAVNAQSLSRDERLRIIDSVHKVVRGINPNQPLLRKVIKVNVFKLLRQLKRKEEKGKTLTNFEFHTEMRIIFNRMDDGHSAYLPPYPLNATLMTLGFTVTHYYEKDGTDPTFVVESDIEKVPEVLDVPLFSKLVSVDGVPTLKAVKNLGEQSFASHDGSRLLSGIGMLTIRSLAQDPTPVNSSVTMTFITPAGNQKVLQLPWQYALMPKSSAVSGMTGSPSILTGLRDLKLQSPTLRPDLQRHYLLRSAQAAKSKNSTIVREDVAGVKLLSEFIVAQTVKIGTFKFAYLKIASLGFNTSVENFLELADIIVKMPKSGMMLDLRGCPGGFFLNVLVLFEFLTDKQVASIPAVVVASKLRQDMIRAAPTDNLSFEDRVLGTAVADAMRNRESLTGPAGNFYGNENEVLFDREVQLYDGPIVVVTDPHSYSGAEILTHYLKDVAGMYVIGAGGATGGASCVVAMFNEDLGGRYPSVFNGPLKSGTDFSMSDWRVFRQGDKTGGNIEYFGVDPDEVYRYTRDDIENSDVDILNHVRARLGAPRKDGGKNAI